MSFPRMARVRQMFDPIRIDNVAEEVEHQLGNLRLAKIIRPRQSVAITAGSRGIANIDVITRTIIDHLRQLQAQPFIVPAMGSHGGGTAGGQTSVLAEYGITEEAMGCEVRSSMETVVVAETPQGVPVYFDRHAYEADHVFVVNRVKPHTGIVGPIESGLHKMMLIGLGKHEGAKIYHRAFLDFSFQEIVDAVAEKVLDNCGVIAGVAIVENQFDETAIVEAIAPEDFLQRETELLKIAYQWLPRLPLDELDLLIIDRFGKNVSGTGMDTNVIGRNSDDFDQNNSTFRTRRIFVRGLTPETKGNATGIGLADFTNNRTLSQINLETTRTNCMTSGHPRAAALPIGFDTDQETIAAALSTIGLTPPENARIIQIQDTLHLSEMLASEACLPLLRDIENVEITSELVSMCFDEDQNLLPV